MLFIFSFGVFSYSFHCHKMSGLRKDFKASKKKMWIPESIVRSVVFFPVASAPVVCLSVFDSLRSRRWRGSCRHLVVLPVVSLGSAPVWRRRLSGPVRRRNVAEKCKTRRHSRTCFTSADTFAHGRAKTQDTEECWPRGRATRTRKESHTSVEAVGGAWLSQSANIHPNPSSPALSWFIFHSFFFSNLKFLLWPLI